MANQKMVRVDYRLVHGQVVAKWIKYNPVKRLILVDNDLVNDDFMGDIYRMAAPDQEVDIVAVNDLQAALDKKDDNVMIIFKDIKSAEEAADSGVELAELNVGAVPSSKDRTTVIQGVSLSKEEFASLKALQEEGVNVYLQPIPENSKVGLESVENKIK
ncbi:PTS sugar transporter subunit IIB [Aerococcus urinae]|uniref:PTS sugar transporter subunit IIB n=1 Tax=Aerococcus TaxID=1375 RepID=UPI0018A7D776|nr:MULTISPECIES: PTS sugar transporter subunit IIB [Aerococcus]MCY3036261.1 PTS sugar transporter subunit IIB [Aerococcus sp. Group 2]MDK6520275.1 PTS sugar transporter subunit IIB [Aerococcus urinae]